MTALPLTKFIPSPILLPNSNSSGISLNMDGVSLGVAIPGFINDTIELKQRFQAAKSFETAADQAQKLLRSNLIRLQLWEEKSGLKDGTLQGKHHPAFEDPVLLSTVQGHREAINELSTKVESVLSRLQQGKSGKQHNLGSVSSLSPAVATTSVKGRTLFPSRSGMKWGFGQDKTVLEDLQNIDKHVDKIYQLVPPVAPEGLNDHKLGGLEDEIKSIQAQFHRAFCRIQQNDINMWIQAQLIDRQFDTHRDARLEGTGDWIFDHTAYKSWLAGERDSRILWVCGPAGTGKTVLCARIIQRLREESSQGPPVVYCFCSAFVQAASQLQEILRTLIAQLAHQSAHMRDQIWNYICHPDSDTGLVASQTNLWMVLKELLVGTAGCTIVIDGLDEFDGSSRARSKFLRKMKFAVKGTLTRVLVSSRDEGDIREELFHEAHVCKVSKDLVHDDIRQLATALICDRLPRKPEDLKQELSERISDKSDGMFLWVKQQDLLQLRGSKTASQLRTVVEKMPAGLTDTYLRNWKEITSRAEDDYERTVKMLRWAAFSFRPLTVAEITEALMVHPDTSALIQDEWPDEISEDYIQEEIKGLCGSLVDIKPSPDGVPQFSTVHIAHASIKEFLLSVQDISISGHHFELSLTCLRYLRFSDVWQPVSHDKENSIPYAFLGYAAQMFHNHIGATTEIDDGLHELLYSLLDPQGSSFSSLRNHLLDTDPDISSDERTERKRQTGNPLWFAAKWNLLEISKTLLKNYPGLLDAVEPGCETPLLRACEGGHVELVNLLIDNNADVQLETETSWCALHQCIVDGNKDLVVSLVGRGLNIEFRDSSGETALHTACHCNRAEIAHFLLGKGAQIAVVCKDRTTPLYWACNHGDFDLVRRLLVASEDLITLETPTGWTPLATSAKQMHIDVLRFLLSNGAQASLDVEADGMTPLLRAATNGNPEILHLLLEHGTDPNAVNDAQRTALTLAAFQGHSGVADVLLNLGVDPNVPSSPTAPWTALQIAAEHCHVEFVKTLLEWSVSPNGQSFSPLHLAAGSGSSEVANILLDYGAAINHADEDGHTALHYAAYNGYNQVLQLLVENGADFRARNHVQVTPLHHAAYSGHLDIAEKLVELGADPNASTEKGESPLINAAHQGHLAMVKFLCDKGADPNVRTNDGWSVIAGAVHFGHLEVVQYLLHKVSSLCEPGNNYGMPLVAIAAHANKPSMVTFLLDHGVDVNAQDNYGRTALHFAAKENNAEVAAMLLDRTADIDSQAAKDETPFHFAVRNGCREVVECLLERGANPAMATKDNWTALHIAAYHKQSELFTLLLDHGLDVKARSSSLNATPLHCAMWGKSYEAAKLLCEHGDVEQLSMETSGGDSALHIAAETELADVVKLLLRHGADPTFGGSTKTPPLYWAAKSGNEDVVRLLLQSGAGLRDLCGSHWNPLHMAAYCGHNSVLDLLTKKLKSICFALDCEGRSALHLAARGGNVSTFNILLEAGFDPSLRDSRKRSVLHYAAASASIAMVERIFQLPCVREMLNGVEGLSVLHWACISGDIQLVQTLISSGVSERSIAIDLPIAHSQWTPWAIAVFYNNRKLLSDAECPLKSRTECSPTVVNATKTRFICDSCEQYSDGPLFRCLTCGWTIDYCFMCLAGVEYLHPGHNMQQVENPYPGSDELNALI